MSGPGFAHRRRTALPDSIAHTPTAWSLRTEAAPVVAVQDQPRIYVAPEVLLDRSHSNVRQPHHGRGDGPGDPRHPRAGRPPTALRFVHAALVATFDDETASVEMAPMPDHNGHEVRGVVAVGAVGIRQLGRFRVFRSEVPTPVWGRDELNTGEMWNSNSVIAWALARHELDGRAGPPPNNGRAPGWASGIAAADQLTVSKPQLSKSNTAR